MSEDSLQLSGLWVKIPSGSVSVCRAFQARSYFHQKICWPTVCAMYSTNTGACPPCLPGAWTSIPLKLPLCGSTLLACRACWANKLPLYRWVEGAWCGVLLWCEAVAAREVTAARCEKERRKRGMTYSVIVGMQGLQRHISKNHLKTT